MDNNIAKAPCIDVISQMPLTGFAASTALAADQSCDVHCWGIFGPECGTKASDLCETFFAEHIWPWSQAKAILLDIAPVVLALLGRTGRVRVWTFDVSNVTVRAQRAMQAGEVLSIDDISDICQVRLPIFPHDDDADGFFMTLRHRFRRATAFLAPCLPPGVGKPPVPDLSVLAASLLNTILFHSRYDINDLQFSIMLEQEWFPFAAFSQPTIDILKEHARCNSNWRDFDELVVSQFSPSEWRRKLDSWKNHPMLQQRVETIELAIERFENDDLVSALHVIMPVIEGVVVQAFGSRDQWPRVATQLRDVVAAGKLATNPVWHQSVHRFRDYLKSVHFSEFDLSAESIKVSRHALAHGALNPASIRPVHVVRSLLILSELSRFRP